MSSTPTPDALEEISDAVNEARHLVELGRDALELSRGTHSIEGYDVLLKVVSERLSAVVETLKPFIPIIHA